MAGAKPGAGNIKLLPGQEVVGPDGKLIATAPAKPATKSTLTPTGLDPTSVWGQFEPARQAAIAAHNAGTLNDDQFKQAMDQITQQAISGLTAAQQADQTYRQGLLANDATQNAVNQGNNRATAAAGVFNNATTTGLDIAKGGGSAADIGNFLKGSLGAAPGFQASMGGAPVNMPGAAGQQHLQLIRQLILSGQAPANANGDRGPAAIAMAQGQTMPGPGDPGFTGGGQTNDAPSGFSVPAQGGTGYVGDTGVYAGQPGNFLQNLGR